MKSQLKIFIFLFHLLLTTTSVKAQFEFYDLCDFGPISKQEVYPAYLIQEYSHSYSEVSGRNEINFYSTAYGDGCRPLIIFIGGGFFVSADPSGMEKHAKYFAQRGYLTATVNYRVVEMDQRCSDLGWWQSTQDINAAIKYASGISKVYDWAGFNNQKVILVGSSAGAVTALTLAYSSNKDMMNYLPMAAYQFGGLESTVFPPYLNSLYRIIGTVSLAGAIPEIINTDGYDFNEIASTLFIHSVGDKTVPYDVNISADCKDMPVPRKVYGPNALKNRITNSTFPPEIITLNSNNHSIPIGNHLDTINSFIYKISTDSSTNYVVLDDIFPREDAHKNNLVIYPNPSDGNFKIKTPYNNISMSNNILNPSNLLIYLSAPDVFQSDMILIELIDVSGRKVYTLYKKANINGNQVFDLQTNLQPGIYTLKIRSSNNAYMKKVIVTN